MRTRRLPVVDRTDAPCRFQWTRPFRRKTKSGFCACAITFQTHYTRFEQRNSYFRDGVPLVFMPVFFVYVTDSVIDYTLRHTQIATSS